MAMAMQPEPVPMSQARSGGRVVEAEGSEEGGDGEAGIGGVAEVAAAGSGV